MGLGRQGRERSTWESGDRLHRRVVPIHERWRACVDRSRLRSSPGNAATTHGRGRRRALLWTSHCPLARRTTRSSTTEEEYMTKSTPEVPRGDLTARLNAGPVICAEGFLFELERRGYLSAGEFVPEVSLEYPDALRALHVDFQRAGSDVVE